jgi:hypothetical protein
MKCHKEWWKRADLARKKQREKKKLKEVRKTGLNKEIIER